MTVQANHQLIVIGNGFDLACTLESSYESFFGDRIRKARFAPNGTKSEWEEYVKKNGLTAWDFLLANETGPNWHNMEEAISHWIVPPNKLSSPLVTELLPMLQQGLFSNSVTSIIKGCPATITIDNARALVNVARYIRCKKGFTDVLAMDEIKLLQFLRGQLSEVENLFKGHLRQKVSSNNAYFDKAKTLISLLVNEGQIASVDPFNTPFDHTSLLSFNYTQPFSMPGHFMSRSNVVNIHGNLDGEIVFGIDGIDGTECMGNPDLLPFTKTYRVASLGTEMTRKLYKDPIGGARESGTNTIKFFGHSLGKADYAYFQSIFDGVNLYGSSTRLLFYYRPWPGKDEDELRLETITAASMLLTTYGATLDNKDHGKNLMHKLLLEGRLEVKKISF